MEKRKRKLDIGDFEIPEDYFSMNRIEKDIICLQMMEEMIKMIDQNTPPMFSRIDLLDKVLESSITTHEKLENFEICSILQDIRNCIE